MEFTGERYLPEEFKLTDSISGEHLKRYEFALGFVRGLSVVDVACGEGYGSNLMATTAKNVTGIDIDLQAVAAAKIKYKKENLIFTQGSVENIIIPDSSVDAVVSFETIEHVSEKIQKKFLTEVMRILKPSGFLIISTPDKDIYGEGHNEFHVREMNFRQFSNQLKKHFKNVIFYGQDVRKYKNIKALFVRRVFHKFIKMDKFQLRYRIFPKSVRSKIDERLLAASTEKTTQSSLKNIYDPIKLKNDETAMYLVAVCRK